MDIVDRIEILCRNSATNITALEKELGLGHGRIRKWKDHSAQSDSVALIARKFNVTTDYLILGENSNVPIPEQFFSSSFTINRENELIEGFRELNEGGWSKSSKVMKESYQHEITDLTEQYAEIMTKYFDALFSET